MPRYIDADEIFYDQLLNTGSKEHPLEYAVSKKRIDDMPTADVVEVVRCKNCVYAIPYNERWTLPKKNNWMWCKRYEDTRTLDWFCADGERREDDEKGFAKSD